MRRCGRHRLDELRKRYEEVVWPKLRELDARADADCDEDTQALELQLSLCWAPYELLDADDDDDR